MFEAQQGVAMRAFGDFARHLFSSRPQSMQIDRIRIGFPDRAAQFVPLPLGEQRGFFREEGLQAEFIR